MFEELPETDQPLCDHFGQSDSRLTRADPRFQGHERGGFEIPAAIPLLGALVCATLFITRLLKSFTGGTAADHVAPLIALGILVGAVVLFLLTQKKSS